MITYKSKIQPLDIIIVYNPRSWLHRLISRVTHYKAGHVALYLGDGLIAEANRSGVHVKEWKDYRDGMRVYLARCPDAVGERGRCIREYAANAVNTPYAFGQLVAILFKNIFRLRHVPDVSGQAMICSEFVARAYRAGDVVLCPGIRPEETTPADITQSRSVFVMRGWE
jgi:uncharacterized protein YycO